ncbi:polysaccharide biosynthesis protein [Pedobacter endophyticus]|uniref:Polysaccharide biosynthesis protein n=1 Tax=Pedobacter endophyticus TaxID=2789740 RepID=A0A7S9L0N6_9SPHI|nr:polysaccharide biosynthesis protein [Pedobacter endophyticus]QPH40258.1 polysaccharide biosynthesis protein [Pedobacter endophyticus]
MNKINHEEIASIYDLVWQLSPKYKDPLTYNTLTDLTDQLIAAYKENGRLDENPFATTADRTLSLPQDEMKSLLDGQVCLVTGGLGCVGSNLVNKLLTFGAKRIVIIDKTKISENPFSDESVTIINCDIVDRDHLIECFKQHQPGLVFHTAAQRNPGYAEDHAFETINDNVIGTLNVVQACELSGSVKHCVFSSTGKASRYFTSEVYAASKKICEFIFDHYAKRSEILYSMVRFTHILDNSLMHTELKNNEEVDHVAIHSPGKYVTAQNVNEAVHLMLNAVICAKPKKSAFLIVRNLEWPVESLEVALYYIQKRGKTIPVIFRGNPPGYKEKFFRGQLDWSQPHDLNLLINVYENNERSISGTEDIITSSILPIADDILTADLAKLSSLQNNADAKAWLTSTLYRCVASSLEKADETDTLKILKWGLDENYLSHEQCEVESFKEIIQILTDSIQTVTLKEEAQNLKANFEHAHIY